MSKKFKVPREFFLELEDLIQAVISENRAGNVSYQTKDALSRVISWFPYLDTKQEEAITVSVTRSLPDPSGAA